MKKQKYRISDFVFEISSEGKFSPPENFKKFETEAEDSEVNYFYSIIVVNELPKKEEVPILSFPDLAIFENNGLESRYLGVKGSDSYYAYYEEMDDTHATSYVLAHEIFGFRYDPIFTSLLALEKRMIANCSMILHCAYIESDGEAILFSAPSGVGKSTQADLWNKYNASPIINGDKALIKKVGEQWHAYGWPTCGTSEICHNISMPIKAIVTLEQSKTNSVKQLSLRQAFQLIYAQITLNRWNSLQMNQVLTMLEDLLQSIPVYHLACNISEDAVQCLEEIIYRQ